MNIKSAIEAILFSAGKEIKEAELISILNISKEELNKNIEEMKLQYNNENRGIELVKVKDSYTLASKKEYYQQICDIVDKRSKPNLSNAAFETLSIIAYNPKVTRSEIEAIRGVNCDGTIYKLLEYELIEEAGKADLPGRPITYRVTNEFLKKFGFENLKQLPKLPKYKVDENEQIIIEEIIEKN